MKQKFNYKTLGILFIAFSSLGLLFSLAGIILTWIVKPGLQRNLLSLSESIEATLSNTNEGLTVLDQSLERVVDNLDIVDSTFNNLDDTFSDISTSLDTSGNLIGDDLRQTIVETQMALSSAASSAEIIDKTLSIISAIPFWGADYEPEVPLHTSLETVAGSMEDIPKSLEVMETGLTDTAEGLELLNDNLVELSGDLTNFKSDITSAQDVLVEYTRIIGETEKQFSEFKSNLPRNLTFFMLFITGILFSLGVAQCITLLQGITIIEGEKKVVNLADISRE